MSCITEFWEEYARGLSGLPAKQLWAKVYRGFESHLLRHVFISARSSVDRALDYGSSCRGFKSSRALQILSFLWFISETRFLQENGFLVIICSMLSDEYFMQEALEEAQKAFEEDEVPIGAVIVQNGEILARAHNLREKLNDPTAHAELIAIRLAADKLNSWRLLDTTIYVTVEPCPMCAGAIVLARVRRLVFGAVDLKAGAAGTLMNLLDDARLNHQVEITGGVLEEESRKLLRTFFLQKRK